MSAEYLQKLFGLDGRVIVVIGGTGVLGGALCEGVAGAGAHVVVAGRSEANGIARAKAIVEAGGKASFSPVDVTERASLEALLAEVLQQHGRVDGLINCAGVNQAGNYFDVKDEDWDRIVDTNLRSTHWGCQIFGKHMAGTEAGGAILNIGSVSSGTPLSRVFAYSASKAAVVNLTQNVARELAPQGVRVNVLCPGFFPAEQNRKILTAERVASIMGHSPMQRFGEPSELVGTAILLLAPNAGSFITGAAYYVDGGFTAMTI
jgi:NAD(P)-dependent dehydrogenase (short-subunit alcohol dehydrogenase family)